MFVNGAYFDFKNEFANTNVTSRRHIGYSFIYLHLFCVGEKEAILCFYFLYSCCFTVYEKFKDIMEKLGTLEGEFV